MLTSNNTAWEFLATPPEIAILPLACFEPHGPHLPVGADEVIVTEIAHQVALQLTVPAFLLPTWPFGTSGHHAGEPGAIYVRFETLWAVVRDTVTALHEHGMHKVAVLNNHGSALASTTRPVGNFVVKTAVRQLNYETPGLTAIWVQPFAAGGEALRDLFASAGQEIHAGAVETSILMHLVPDLVGPLPEGNVPSADLAYLDLAPFKKVAPSGVWGRPGEGSAEKGKQALQAVVTATTGYIERTFAQLAQLKEEAKDTWASIP